VLRRRAGSAGGSARKRAGLGILVAVMVVVPAAIAWACNPQAHVTLDRTTASPGQTVTMYGSYFPGNVNIQVSTPQGTQTVTTSNGGSFAKSFVIPSKPGSYVVNATRPTGGAASAAFVVKSPTTTTTPAQAPASSNSPAAAAPRAPSFDSPSVVQSERQRSTSGSGGNDGGGSGSQAAPNTGTGSGGGVVVTPSGATVFAGSVPAASTGTFSAAPAQVAATGSSKAAKSSSTTPSDQAAAGYVWSGFAPGKTPSLATAGDMVSEGDSGSGLGLGIALLAFGLLALVGGLTAAEVSRRRSAA
jgi:hypothetical protein